MPAYHLSCQFDLNRQAELRRAARMLKSKNAHRRDPRSSRAASDVQADKRSQVHILDGINNAKRVCLFCKSLSYCELLKRLARGLSRVCRVLWQGPPQTAFNSQ